VDAPHTFALTHDVWRGQWWRLWTGHLVHYSAAHLLLNATALVPPLVLTPARRRMAIWSLIAAPLLSLLLLATSTFDEYRGASGLIVGIWLYVSVELWRDHKRIAIAMITAITLKLLLEATNTLPWSNAIAPSHAAHYLGAILGAFGGIFNAVADSRQVPTSV
jgi:membrane associated rhomboid family serine protease